MKDVTGIITFEVKICEKHHEFKIHVDLEGWTTESEADVLVSEIAVQFHIKLRNSVIAEIRKQRERQRNEN